MKDEELKSISVTIDSDKIVKILTDYIALCESFINVLKKRSLTKFQFFLFSTIKRFCSNVKALNIIFPQLKNDKTFKLPIALLLRSIVSDCLTVNYLVTFYVEDDEFDTAIINEIAVLDRNFIKFQKELLTEELKYKLKKKIAPWLSDKDILEKLDSFDKKNPAFFIHKEGKLKLISIETLRETTPLLILDEQSRKTSLTDKDKFERLKKTGKDNIGILSYITFKYFSQYQHPSSNMNLLLTTDPVLLDNRMFLISIDLLISSTINMFKFINR